MIISDRFKGFIGKQQTQKEVVDSDGNGGGFNDEADQKEGYSDDSFDSGSQKNEQKGQEIKEDIPTHQSYTRNFEGYFCTWKDSNINMKMEMLMYQLFNDPNIAGKGTSFYPQINPNYKVDHPSRYPSMQKLTHSPQLEYYGKISDKSYNDEMGKFDKNGILTTRYIGFYSKSDRFRRFREEVDSYIP